ncbi:folate-biopterin transporter [bacterium BMS3Bbin10]|nr:folate-biopterin transporter [bacterium BMS3Bbin10]
MAGSRALADNKGAPPAPRPVSDRLKAALVAPVKAMRLRYLPLLMVYFAYGALGLVGIAESFWIKQALTMTPAELAGLGVWLTLPWTIKMVFGQIVDSVALFGSQRRVYVFAGAGLVAAGLVILAGAAGGWFPAFDLDTLYVAAKLVIVIGIVFQDVVADAMSTEVVDRENPDGSPRPKKDIEHDLGMVQVLGRLALTFGIFAVAGLGGLLAQIYSYQSVFLLGLAIPAISITGALLVRLERVPVKPVDWRILGGGAAFGAVVAALGLGGVPYSQELIFLVSMAVVVAMLFAVVGDLEVAAKRKIFFAAIIIFVFRATPGVGEGYRWFSIDVLGFDEAFFGTLAQIGAGLAMAGTWLLADTITRRPVALVLLWLTVFYAILSLPNVALVYRVDEWTSEMFGFGARTIALIDTAAESPFAQLSMIPMLTLIAIHAPAGRRATWFALMASLMNLALVAGQLQTKYLNWVFAVDRGQYGELPVLLVSAVIIGFVAPLTVILLFGRRAT